MSMVLKLKKNASCLIGFIVLANLRIVAMVVHTTYIYPFNNMHSTNNDIQYLLMQNKITCFKLWAPTVPHNEDDTRDEDCILKNPLECCLLRKHHSVNLTLHAQNIQFTEWNSPSCFQN